MSKVITKKISEKQKIKIKFHPSIASGRWFALPIAEQLRNIGGEVSRALNWKEKKMPKRASPALVARRLINQ